MVWMIALPAINKLTFFESNFRRNIHVLFPHIHICQLLRRNTTPENPPIKKEDFCENVVFSCFLSFQIGVVTLVFVLLSFDVKLTADFMVLFGVFAITRHLYEKI